MLKLWDFALDFYARPGVEADCLALQERGVDVCLLLCCAWLFANGTPFEPARFASLQGIASSWQDHVIAPLRRIRRDWKEGAREDTALSALRERLKRLELDGERILLERLETATASWPKGRTPSPNWLTSATQIARDDAATQRLIERLRGGA
ncbi:TIGR02444 family protein [Pseudomonas matsuisoli]|uniref:TIGR02444 family protein n=1 Tax=Pseudomonas matsuisoli TaxID=1515666 RepID=A0A917UYM8_9PSED|nr:TIGR02444 family protein [Pseudomonas matsuisoli]GGJ96305.1 hypothetical protein GCM10009304_22790 [Pseudomonas matsuisoli]